ncbi:hypothetical protein GN244_ATG16323 [Phytophthora infestans]|uniref:Uncharacterized protein n=1 Tax=Phytophthora infestans TaxID=4787 RepID=A0A833SIH7_PHYIN|nr:hypothetical protein GN244_ATG16323 [Phytophthora infestans]
MSGVITVQFGASTTSGSQLGAAFTENKQYIGIASNRATGPVLDGTLYAPAEPKSSFTFGRELGTRRFPLSHGLDKRLYFRRGDGHLDAFHCCSPFGRR